MTTSITARLQTIMARLPQNVCLIAVTKQVGVEAMREAYGAGVRDFGENRLQEALEKQQQLQELSDVRWHFIGHLQKNKARKVLQHFDWIHSVDSLDLALRLERIAAELSIVPQVLLQVKMLPDPQKYGWEPQQLRQDIPQLQQCQQLKIQGLMTILPLGLSQSETLTAFKRTANLAEQIRLDYPSLSMNQLSMGMSDDYVQAVEAGATMIRLGRIIFGERAK